MKTVVFLDTHLSTACRGYPLRIGREEIGAQLVAACCQEAGFKVRYLKPNTTQLKAISSLVNDGDCDILVLFPYAYTKWLADKIARLFKGQVPIIYGGYQTGMDEQNAQKLLDEGAADYVVWGRGDSALPQLLSALANRKAEKGVWRQEPIISSSKYPLDNLPWPMRNPEWMQNLITDPITFHPPKTLEPNPQKLVIVAGAIGCKGRCDFCISHKISPLPLHRSPENIVKEMISLQKEYGPGLVFFFSNPLFNADSEWVMKLCSEMANKGPFPSIVMTDFCLDSKMVQAMKNGGIYLNMMGLEFANDKLRVKRGKRACDPSIAYRLCSEAGILTRAFYMLGRLGMTRQDLQEETKAIMSLPFYADELRINFEVPFSGTKIAATLKPNDLIIDPAHWTTEEPVYRTELTSEEWQDIRQQMIYHYHFRPAQKEHYERQSAKFPALETTYETFLANIENAYQ